MWACLLEAFDDYGKYFLTDHALLIYEAYVNIVECVLYEFQLLTLKWQKLARATGKQRRLCNVVPLISYAAVPDGAAAWTNPSRPSRSLENIFTEWRKKLLPVPAAPEKLSRQVA